MRGKTGAARLWLATGAPVSRSRCGARSSIFDPRTHKLRPVPRTPVTVVAGPPLDLCRWQGAHADHARCSSEITEHIMLVLRDMVAELRGRARRHRCGARPVAHQSAARRLGGSEG